MTTFLNYDNLRGFTLCTYRNEGVSCDDVIDFLEEVEKGHPCTMSCDVQETIDALEDGSIWGDVDVSQEAIEDLHNFLSVYSLED